jgi:hypothetical protein
MAFVFLCLLLFGCVQPAAVNKSRSAASGSLMGTNKDTGFPPLSMQATKWFISPLYLKSAGCQTHDVFSKLLGFQASGRLKP